MPFGLEMATRFSSPDVVRISLTWFGSAGNLVLPLTSDSASIENAINGMIAAPSPAVNQGTNIGAGLETVLLQLIEMGDAANDSTKRRFVFIVSDGCEFQFYRANTAKVTSRLKDEFGVKIMVVYVPSASLDAEVPSDYSNLVRRRCEFSAASASNKAGMPAGTERKSYSLGLRIGLPAGCFPNTVNIGHCSCCI